MKRLPYASVVELSDEIVPNSMALAARLAVWYNLVARCSQALYRQMEGKNK